MSEYREAFFKHANKLVDDKETPDSVVLVMARFAHSIRSPMMGRWVFFNAVRGMFRPGVPSGDLKIQSFVRDVDNMRADLRAALVVATANYALAITYNNFFIGILMRRMLFYWLLPKPTRANERLVEQMAPQLVRKNSDDCLMPAA